MKPFDKRSVPGLEDCSSDSDSDNETINKKLRYDDDVEIEIEVKNNEFLKEETVSKGKSSKSRTNTVWRNVAQDEILDESIRNVSVNKFNVKRQVESYTINNGQCNPNKAFNKKDVSFQRRNRKLPVKDRLINRTFDKFKNRNHNLNPSIQSADEIVSEIARILCEPKLDLIGRCYNVLGFQKCLEFLYMTEDIEESGGLLVVNGSRRRSPGGVFLNLIKESPDVNPEDLKRIFSVNNMRRRGPIHNGANPIKDNKPLIEIVLAQPIQPVVPISIDEQNSQTQTPFNDDYELEDGEIL